MRKILATAAFLLFGSLAACSDDDGPTIEPDNFGWKVADFKERWVYTDIFFLDRQNGWISTWADSIMRTRDGGLTWEPLAYNIPISTGNEVRSIAFIDQNHGWATTEDSRLLRTKDGGETWEIQHAPRPFCQGTICSSLGFLNKEFGWYLSRDELSHWAKTTDGGESWQLQRIHRVPSGPAWQTMHFWSEDDGMLLGSSNSSAAILRTSDGGESWELKEWPDLGMLSEFSIVNNHIWMAGNSGTILRSSDSGSSWENVSLSESCSIFRITFVDENNGWLLAGSPNDCVDTKNYTDIMFTTDGGLTWKRQLEDRDRRAYPEQFGDDALQDIEMLDAQNGWMISSEGWIYKTETGGVAP